MSHPVRDQIARFEAVCSDPYAAARERAATGGRVAGYMCVYVPLELLHAAGYLPVRVFGREGGMQHASAHLPSYACSVAHSALDMGLSGELDFLDLMVFSHTCDTMQNLADIWAANLPSCRSVTLDVPTCVDPKHGLPFLRRKLEALRQFLESVGGEISDEALGASIRLHDEHRGLMNRLSALRVERPDVLTGRAMQAVTQAALLMPRDQHLEAVQELIQSVESATASESRGTPRVFVTGSVCQNGAYIAVMEEAGCVVTGDSLCTGTRAFAMNPSDDGDPLERLARMYLSRTPCPAKHRPGHDAAEALLDDVRGSGANGVVFLLTKFCDPWGFEYIDLRKALEKQGIPSLMLEIEQHQPPPGQLRTRVAAFVEMLAARFGGGA
jgi:benzoyl-CoA reductase subunit C